MVITQSQSHGMDYFLSLRRCKQSGQTRRKTYGPGETQDHTFRANLLYITELSVHTGQIN